MKEKLEQCSICKTEYTSMHIEVSPGVDLYVCSSCAEKAKANFIWICSSCGQHYMRPKELVIARTKDPELKKAYMLCKDEQIFQGIDMCVACDSQGIAEFVASKRKAAQC